MKLIRIYECLCDETRLRILHLLLHGPLCVCHIQSVIGASQTRVSQHLAYLRERDMVRARRDGAWMIYSLPSPCPQELDSHLRCLQDCVQSDRRFRADLRNLARVNRDYRGVNDALTGKSSCKC